jgi:hypothetical protein
MSIQNFGGNFHPELIHVIDLPAQQMCRRRGSDRRGHVGQDKADAFPRRDVAAESGTPNGQSAGWRDGAVDNRAYRDLHSQSRRILFTQNSSGVKVKE